MRNFELVVMGILSVFFVTALFQGVPDLPSRNLDGSMRNFGEAVTTAALQENAAPAETPMSNEQIQIAVDQAVQQQFDVNALANIEPAAGDQSEPENIGYIGDDGKCYCTVESIK